MFRAGSNIPISKADILTAASAYSVDPALLAAFLVEECSWRLDGRLHGFRNDLSITRRFEKHHVKRHVKGKGAKQKIARLLALGLITAGWKPGQKGGPTLHDQAYNIAPRATIKASSYGLSQILGAHYRVCGFQSAAAFVEFMCRSERHQLDVTMKLFAKWDVIREMQESDYRGMARIWNGQDYAKHNYHGRLARSHRKMKPLFNVKGATIRDVPPTNKKIMRVGSRGKTVASLQEVLIFLGYKIAKDGDFGPATRAAIVDFQEKAKIAIDGIVGGNTSKALNRAVIAKQRS